MFPKEQIAKVDSQNSPTHAASHSTAGYLYVAVGLARICWSQPPDAISPPIWICALHWCDHTLVKEWLIIKNWE